MNFDSARSVTLVMVSFTAPAIGSRFDSAARIPFGFQFRPEFVASFEYEALGRVDLDNLASVGEPPVGKDHLP
jgi:hypothetical protein